MAQMKPNQPSSTLTTHYPYNYPFRYNQQQVTYNYTSTNGAAQVFNPPAANMAGNQVSGATMKGNN